MSNPKYFINDTLTNGSAEWVVRKIVQIKEDYFYTIENEFLGKKECLESYLDDLSKVNKRDTFKPMLDSIGEVLEVKNKRYGNSALKPKNIFAKHHTYGARLDEKLSRIENSNELRKNDVFDIIGGALLICKDKGWTDFRDQID